VAVSEWSLWFVLFAIASVIFAGLSKNPTVLYSTIIIGAITCAMSVYPYFTSFSVAKEKGITLSFRQYFNAIIGEKPKETSFQTRVFATNNGIELKLDVYSPTAEKRNGKSVIVVHGGSWSGGVRNDFPQWNQWFAENGFTVFDIDYSLTQPNYSSAIGDIKSAVKWVKNHSAEFNISPDKINLLGRSAGGHLALLSAYTADDKRFSATSEENAESEKVQAVISIYAPTDLFWAYNNKANPNVIDGPTTLSNFLGGNPYQSDELRERYSLMSPVTHINAQTPPTLLIHGGKDQLVRADNMYFAEDRLKTANVSNQTLYIPYGQHGFDYNFNGWGSQITKSVILNFLNKKY
jgi:acetyl esterase/lipase